MSAPINDGGPAFPYAAVSEVTGQPINGCFNAGMTLRDYFAAHSIRAVWGDPDVKAMAAVKANSHDEAAQLMCKAAYAIADRMLKEREAQP